MHTLAGIPEEITVDWLRMQRACKDQIELFGRTFGAAARLTAANIMVAASAGLDIGWFARRLLVTPAWAEYERIVASAWAEYGRRKVFARADYDRAAASALIGMLWPDHGDRDESRPAADSPGGITPRGVPWPAPDACGPTASAKSTSR